jgi:hypothetical protein
VCERHSSDDELELGTVGAGGIRVFGKKGEDGLLMVFVVIRSARCGDDGDLVGVFFDILKEEVEVRLGRINPGTRE